MILVINCGSQSMKWKVFDARLHEILHGGKNRYDKSLTQKDIREELTGIKKKGISIRFVGHRVVHPIYELAPLHNPSEHAAMKIAKAVFPTAKHHTAFDTDYFNDLPAVSRLYPLPESVRKKYLIQRFGFHGTSHKYLAGKAAESLKKPLKNLNVITLHLGGGCSITAVKRGKPVDTSMGFTPLEGLTMMSRAGDIDPGIVLFLVKKMGIKKVEHMLNRESGLLAIAGVSNYKEILTGKDKASKLAIDMFVYRIRKYLAAYTGVLGGSLDAIVFSGTIGAGLAKTRKLILKGLPCANKTKILVIPTDEEHQIAQDIKERWKKSFAKTQ